MLSYFSSILWIFIQLITGMTIYYALQGYMKKNKGKGNHIITPKTEHKAVLDTCSVLEQQGFQITYLNVLNNGLIDINELAMHLS